VTAFVPFRGRGALFGALGWALLAAAPAAAAEAEGGVIGFDLGRVINFSILAAILAWALRKPLGGYLNARAEQIRERLAAARENRRRAEVAAERADRVTASVDEEVSAARKRILETARVEGRRIVAAAEEQAARVTAAAEEQVAAEVRSAERRLAARTTRAVAEAAAARLRDGVSAEDHRRLAAAGVRAIRSR